MKKYKLLIIASIFLAGCLNTLDRSKKTVSEIINRQHQILIDFVLWDKKHQLKIVDTAKSKSIARKQLIDYRARRDKLINSLVDLLEDENPDALVGLLDGSESIIVVNKLKKQADDLVVKILEFERGEK